MRLVREDTARVLSALGYEGGTPRLDDAIYWLRNRYCVMVVAEIASYVGLRYDYVARVYAPDSDGELTSYSVYDSSNLCFRNYDDALEAGLESALEIITKTKKP